MSYQVGIDISPWQAGMINWDTINKPFKYGNDTYQVSHCYVKTSEDASFAYDIAIQQANRAFNAGLKVGFYHYAKPAINNLEADAIAEANFFVAAMRKYKYELTPVLDIETNPFNLSPAQMLLWIKTFIAQMKSLGHDTIIYSYAYFLNQFLPKDHDLGSHKLWVAQYGVFESQLSIPHGWSDWNMWQFSGKFVHPSLKGGTIDLNFIKSL